ncbi:hypothetical protein DVH24_005214 [Malus domestica]|uniref:Secreted protein n=1 Tax=Malus domestica TaxID=3750 RepID=A0A498IDQ0_MALDO|nr:hypothetical protein DVH24_005214 [Malus domestica]
MFVCVRCVRVWLRALCHLCVCVWVSPVRRTHDSLSIPDKPWMVVSFKTVCRYCFKRWSIRAISSSIIAIQSLFDYFISLTPFKVIPDPFQSLNTKGSIFKDNFNMFNVIYYFISLTIFKAIPDPFQSLNTKGSIFKVSLQTYIYIIVIYTTTNKFVWTRMLIQIN